MRGAIPLLKLLTIHSFLKLSVFCFEDHEIVNRGFKHELGVTSFGSDGLLVHGEFIALIGVHPRHALEWLT